MLYLMKSVRIAIMCVVRVVESILNVKNVEMLFAVVVLTKAKVAEIANKLWNH